MLRSVGTLFRGVPWTGIRALEQAYDNPYGPEILHASLPREAVPGPARRFPEIRSAVSGPGLRPEEPAPGSRDRMHLPGAKRVDS